MIIFLFNILRPERNGRIFEDIFKCFFLIENLRIVIEISMNFVSESSIDN